VIFAVSDMSLAVNLQVISTLCHAEIICEQNASKIVKKNISTDIIESNIENKSGLLFLGHSVIHED